MAGNREFDPGRFKALVLYIAWRTKDDPRFGRTKLAKVLFYSDLAAYAEEGQAITGVSYYHYPFGPFPHKLWDVLDTIENEGSAEVERLGGDDRAEKKIRPHSEPVFVFDEAQRFIVDSYIRKISELSTWQVSDQSHDHPGWLITKDMEEIPYHSALMSRRRPTRHDLERGEELASEHGWP